MNHLRFLRTSLTIAFAVAAFGCSDDADSSNAAFQDTGVDAGFVDASDADHVDQDDLGNETDLAFIPDMAADLAGSDMSEPDAGSPDFGGDMALSPLGLLAGECGDIDMSEILAADSFVFSNVIDFGSDPYDMSDFERLSEGGQEIITDGNAGGSSILSEVFAYEVLYRCEMATLLKTENEVVYDTAGKITDLLVEVDGYRLGVSVTRAVAFPRDTEYTVARAQTLLEGKLSDILVSSMNVAAVDAWEKQILHVIADETRHRDALISALEGIDTSIKADTIVIITVSEGDDAFLY